MSNIPHSCEYCIHCICNDWYYCESKEELRNVSEETIKRKNKCKKYEGCETSVITMEEYRPRGYTKPIPEWMKL